MEVFIKEVRKVVSLEPNAISIYDDVLVFGATQEESVDPDHEKGSVKPAFGDTLWHSIFW